jgi:DNA polymerase-3 subunit delta
MVGKNTAKSKKKTAAIGFDAFEKNIARAALAPVYVVAGPEELHRRKAIDLIRARAEAAAGSVAPREIQCPQNPGELAAIDLPDILDYLRSKTLFGGMSMVVLRRADLLLGRAKRKDASEEDGGTPARDILMRYAEKPCKDACLVIELDADAKLAAARNLAAHGVLVDCRALYDSPPPWQRGTARPSEVAQWIRAECARKYQKTISIEAASEMADMVGGSLSRISNELEKLALLVGDKKEIETEDVEKSAGHVKTHGLFTLLDAVTERDLGKSLRMLAEIFSRGMALGRGEVVFDGGGIAAILIGQIYKRMATLRRAARTMSQGGSVEDLKKRFRITQDWRAERLAAQARNFKDAEFAAIIKWLLKSDEALKTSSMPPEPILESLLVKICKR